MAFPKTTKFWSAKVGGYLKYLLPNDTTSFWITDYKLLFITKKFYLNNIIQYGHSSTTHI